MSSTSTRSDRLESSSAASHEPLLPTALEKILPKAPKQLLFLLDCSRLILVAGAVFRAFSHRRMLPEEIQTWQREMLLGAVLAYIAFQAFLRIAGRTQLKQELRAMGLAPQTTGFPAFKRHIVWNIILDSIFCTFFYVVTLNPESEFFVFYFIPLTTALVFLAPFEAVCVLLLTVFEIVISAIGAFALEQRMPPAVPLVWTPAMLVTHVIFARAFSFAMVLLPLVSLVLLTRFLQSHEARMRGARHDAILRALPEFLFTKNPQGQFELVSGGFCEFVQRARRDVEGRYDRDFFSEEDVQAFLEDDGAIFAGTTEKIGPKEERNTLKLPGGGRDTRYVMVTKVPVYDGGSKVIEVLGIALDISQQKRKQRDMFRFFTHDFPKPLDWIRTSYVPALVEHCDATKAAPTHRQAADACHKLMVCCDFLLACGRAYGFLSGGYPEHWNPTEFKLHEPVDIVLQIIKPQNADIRFFKEVSQKQRVKSDLEKITAMLYLMISNSVKAIRQVKDCPDERRRIQIRVTASASRLRLAVEDAGCGIKPEDFAEAFKLGFSRFNSTGFGLYIVKSFAELGAGQAWFETKGTGACCNAEMSCEIIKPTEL